MLAAHHEALAETAPAKAPESVTAAPAEASTSKAKDEEKKEPVTKQDHIDTAADLMSDIQIETYSSMDKREKTELCVSPPLATIPAHI